MDIDLNNAVRAVLHPLIRYLIGRGWTYPVLCELLKDVYIAEATRPESGEASATDSRVSLLTGIHRKEVRRRRAEQTEAIHPAPLRRDAGIAVLAVTRWANSAPYIDSRRKPRPLPLRATGKQPSFESLVKSLRADMRPSAVLGELVRSGVASLENDRVRLLRNAYVPDVPGDKLAFLGANVGDHLRSALHNLVKRNDPFLERAVYYGLVDAEALGELRPALFKQAERFLGEINGMVMPLNEAAMKQPAPNGRRMRLGVYYYEDTMLPTTAAHGKRRKPK